MPFISAGDGDLKSAFITDAWLIDQFVGNRLWTWGNNPYGQLGDSTTLSKSAPIQTVSNTTNWKQVGGNERNTIGLKTDGTLWVLGYNFYGTLGDNSTTDKSSPVQTIGAGTNWRQVACGLYHMAAIKTDGTLWCWGNNDNGQLGDNTIVVKSSPVQTVALGNNWMQIACGRNFTTALKTDGSLWCWGQNANGQLGDNTITNKSSPIQTVTFGTNWKQISCGSFYASAIKTDGTLWIWGRNSYGNLGINAISHRSSPIQTIAYGTNWKQVSCGYYHTSAIKTDGTLWSWGIGIDGEMANNSILDRSSPVQTITFATNWKFVACGNYHTSAIKTDGTLWTWGWNFFGQLGDNTRTHRSSPVQTAAYGTNWKQNACNGNTSAAVTYGD